MDIGAGQYWSGTNNNVGVAGGAAFQIGRNTNATVYLASGTLTATNTPASAYINLGYLAQGSLWVTNGAVIANRTLLGSGNTGKGTLVVSGASSTYTNTSTFIIGNVAGSTGNSVVVSDFGSLMINSTFTLGNTSSGGNSLLLDSNAKLWTGAATTIGSGSSNNTATVQGNALWSAGGQALTVGSLTATGNVLTVNGGTITNAGTINVGYGVASAKLNAITVTNANIHSGMLVVGRGGSSNTVNVLAGTTWRLANNSIIIGGSPVISGGADSGISSATAIGNQLLINGGIVTNASRVGVGSSDNRSGVVGGYKNSLAVTNGGKLFVQGLIVVGDPIYNNSNPMNSNTMVIANGGQVFSVGGGIGGATISYGSAFSNVIQIVGGGSGGPSSTWNLGAGNFSFNGNTSTRLNRPIIDGAGVAGGAVVTNVGVLDIGGVGNSVLLTNGARLFTRGGVNSLIGDGDGMNSNSVTLVGGTTDSIWNAGGGTNSVGYGRIGTNAYNTLTVGAGGIFTNVGVLSIGTSGGQLGGFGAGAGGGNVFSNQMVVTNGGKVFTVGNLFVGNASWQGNGAGPANSNAVLIVNGGIVNVGAGVIIGKSSFNLGNSSFNSLTISTGGQLFSRADSIIAALDTGANSNNNNTVTIGGNLNGTNATWDLGGFNLSVGYNTTVSGRAFSNSVTVGSGGGLTNVRTLAIGVGTGYTTNNYLLVDGGSVNARTVTVTKASNFVTLNSGTLSIANTTVYSNGTTFVVGNGTDAASLVLNGGAHRFQVGLTVANSGTLSGNGTVVGAVNVLDGGTLAPGNSVGIFRVGALTLASNSTFAVELGGLAAGSFDQLIVTGNASLSNSVLNVSLINAFVPNIGDSFLILTNSGSTFGTFAGLTNGAQLVSGGSAFEINYFAGDGNDVLLTTVVIPEPSALALVGLGLLGTVMFRRFVRRRA